MGNNVSSVGDIFFPGNPDRRRRAEELKQQIIGYGNEFQNLKTAHDATMSRIRPKLDELLAKQGYQSSQSLESHVSSILQGQELEAYNRLKQQLDTSQQAQGVVFDLISMVGAATGAIAGVAFLAGIVTGPVALAAVGAVGEILAAVAILVVVFGIIEGAVERDRLRDAINKLWPQRAQIRQDLERMRAIWTWSNAIEIWLSDPTTSDPSMLPNLLRGTLNSDYEQWTMSHTYDVLLAMDRQNHSWTDEDPSRDSLPQDLRSRVLSKAATSSRQRMPEMGPGTQMLVEGPPTATIGIETSPGVWEEKTLTYTSVQDAKTCVVTDGTSSWTMVVIQFDPQDPTVHSSLFNFIPAGARNLSRMVSANPPEQALVDCAIRIDKSAPL